MRKRTFPVRIKLASVAAAYAALDAVGTKFEVPFGWGAGLGGILESLVVVENNNGSAAAKPVLGVMLFSGEPALGTYTDNSAFDPRPDAGLIIGNVEVTAADYVTSHANIGVAVKHPRLGVRPPAGKGSIWAACYVVSGTPTLAAGHSIQLIFGFDADE